MFSPSTQSFLWFNTHFSIVLPNDTTMNWLDIYPTFTDSMNILPHHTRSTLSAKASWIDCAFSWSHLLLLDLTALTTQCF